jgi:hypothetical protein
MKRREPEFGELVGDDLPREEAERLRRVHELLLEAGPLPELPPSLEEPSLAEPRPARENPFQLLPRRRLGAMLALAAAIALIAFLGGYIAGYRHGGFTGQYSVRMHGVKGLAASATISVGQRDSFGNWPLKVEIEGLPKLKAGGYYEMFLTRGDRRFTCGTFAGGGDKEFNVRLSVPYDFRRGDGWIVTVERPGRPSPGATVLTT